MANPFGSFVMNRITLNVSIDFRKDSSVFNANELDCGRFVSLLRDLAQSIGDSNDHLHIKFTNTEMICNEDLNRVERIISQITLILNSIKSSSDDELEKIGIKLSYLNLYGFHFALELYYQCLGAWLESWHLDYCDSNQIDRFVCRPSWCNHLWMLSIIHNHIIKIVSNAIIWLDLIASLTLLEFEWKKKIFINEAFWCGLRMRNTLFTRKKWSLPLESEKVNRFVTDYCDKREEISTVRERERVNHRRNK